MPANLPPEYFEAEKRYRQARSPEEKVEALEAMLSIMPKHKGTDRLRAELRTKIAKFTREAERKLATSRRGGTYYIRKEGAGQVTLVGLPNVGKSQLLATLTGASPAVADYPFTTHSPTPGMMKYENIQIQLVDIPPIVDRDAHPWLHNLLRGANILLLMVDLSQEPIGQVEAIFEELESLRIKPLGQEGEAGEPYQKRAIIVGTKDDVAGAEESYRELTSRYGEEFPLISISATWGKGLKRLREEIYRRLDIIRVYTKAPGMRADVEEPVILKRGSTVEDFARSIHKDFHAGLKYALLWGSGKYDGQRVKREYVLEDGDIVELHA